MLRDDDEDEDKPVFQPPPRESGCNLGQGLLSSEQVSELARQSASQFVADVIEKAASSAAGTSKPVLPGVSRAPRIVLTSVSVEWTSEASGARSPGSSTDELLGFPLVIGMTPPVRLRMTSMDCYSARSMLVSWVDQDGSTQNWNSSEDPLQNGWYECEKLLPPHVTDITVSFQVKGPYKRWDICKVDRRNACSWVMGDSGQHLKEEIKLREGHTSDPVDAVFELKGPPHRCFVHKAWNAALEDGEHDTEWEHWDDDETRPPKEEVPQTLRAADLVVPPQECSSLESYFSMLTTRLCVAAMELILVHRETIVALTGLDSTCTNQWLTANVGTTASAGLMVAAVPMTFMLPPVGLGMAVVGGVAGGAAMGGGSIGERWTLGRLRSQLSRDSWNAFVVAGILAAWIEAGKAMSKRIIKAADLSGSNRKNSNKDGAKGAVFAAAALGDEAVLVLPILGPVGLIVGAVLTTGIALHGWTQRKFSQQELREKIDELRSKILFFQCLLARLGKLDCSHCLETITEEQEIRRCTKLLHCFHADCLSDAKVTKLKEVNADGSPKSDEDLKCPKCGFPLHENTCTFKDIPEGLVECLETLREADRPARKKSGTMLPSIGGGTSTLSSFLPKRPSIGMPRMSFGKKERGSTPNSEESPGREGEASPESKLEPETNSAPLDDSLIWHVLRQLDRLSAGMSDPADSDLQVQMMHSLLCECEAEKGDMEKLLEDSAAKKRTDLALQCSHALELLQNMRERFDAWKKTFEESAEALIVHRSSALTDCYGDSDADASAAMSDYNVSQPLGRAEMQRLGKTPEIIVETDTPPGSTPQNNFSSERSQTFSSERSNAGQKSGYGMSMIRSAAEAATAASSKISGMKGAAAEKAAQVRQGVWSSMGRKKDGESTPLRAGAEVAGTEGAQLLEKVSLMLDALATIVLEAKPTPDIMQQGESHINECVASKEKLQEIAASAGDTPQGALLVVEIDDTLKRISAMADRYDLWRATCSPQPAPTGAVASAFSKMKGMSTRLSLSGRR